MVDEPGGGYPAQGAPKWLRRPQWFYYWVLELLIAGEYSTSAGWDKPPCNDPDLSFQNFYERRPFKSLQYINNSTLYLYNHTESTCFDRRNRRVLLPSSHWAR